MASRKPSAIALDECFATGDDAFLEELRAFPTPKKLIQVTDKWLQDPRPWARDMIRAYVAMPWNCPGHEAVLKRLFKHAEAQNDHEQMGWFLVALDRVVRRKRIRRTRYNYQTREVTRFDALLALPNTVPRARAAAWRRPHQLLFTHRTRYYLRRRVWRYFRKLAHRDPSAYRTTLASTLAAYEDKDFAKGEHIIDNWSLMHACYFGSPVIRFGPSLVYLVEGQSLNDLATAPYRPELWQESAAFAPLLQLIGAARSTLVRQWAMDLVQRDHLGTVSALALDDLLPLLTHEDPNVQEFAAGLFASMSNLGAVPLETWLRLLDSDHLPVLVLLCEAIQKHVAPERFDNAQLLDLACHTGVPVARLGFDLLRARHKDQPLALDELAGLAAARCEVVAGDVTTWALAQLGASETYDIERVIPFFDTLAAGGRRAALAWLQPETPGWQDPRLWARLIETPFGDVRDALIARLEQRVQRPSPDPDQLTSLWCTVILGVHRGGRQKPKAVRQIVRAIQHKPQRADKLAPVLAIAVRSIRGPEQRAGLAAIAELVETVPTLRTPFAELLPELAISEAGGAA